MNHKIDFLKNAFSTNTIIFEKIKHSLSALASCDEKNPFCSAISKKNISF